MNCYCINKRKIIHHQEYVECYGCGSYSDCETFLTVGSINDYDVEDKSWQGMKNLLKLFRKQKLERILK